MVIIGGSILIFLFWLVLTILTEPRDNPWFGCGGKRLRKHNWEITNEERGYILGLGYTTEITFKCEKCRKEITEKR